MMAKKISIKIVGNDNLDANQLLKIMRELREFVEKTEDEFKFILDFGDGFVNLRGAIAAIEAAHPKNENLEGDISASAEKAATDLWDWDSVEPFDESTPPRNELLKPRPAITLRWQDGTYSLNGLSTIPPFPFLWKPDIMTSPH